MHIADERRRSQRFPLGLPLEVTWRETTGEVHEPATLRDISATGVYFVVEHSLEPESKVEFFVRLQLEGTQGPGVLLHCVGSILRVERTPADPKRVGVAARIDHYRFVRPEEGGEETSFSETKN